MENPKSLHWIKEIFERKYNVNLGSALFEDDYMIEYFDFDHRLALRIYRDKFAFPKGNSESTERVFFSNAPQEEVTLHLVFPFFMDKNHQVVIERITRKTDYQEVLFYDIAELLDEAKKIKVDYKEHLNSFPSQGDLRVLSDGDKSDYFELKRYFEKSESTSQDTRKKSVKGLDKDQNQPKINLEKEDKLDLSKSPKQKSIKGLDDDPDLRRVPLRRKTKFDSSAPPMISEELIIKNYFFAKVYWESSGNQIDRFIKENIWEVETGFSKYANLVQEGAILLGITPPNRHNVYIQSDYRIKAIGYVYKNEAKANKLNVVWRKVGAPGFKAEDIASNINLSLGEITKSKVIPILQEITSTIQPTIESIIDKLKEKAENLLKQEQADDPENLKKESDRIKGEIIDDSDDDIIQEEDTFENITRLAGIQSDSDDGDDYLDIERDVSAFARVMSAKSFNPPLAIGLLGKWGSGKSFFMRKLQEKVEELSSREDQNIYCKGIAHIHFNAWSYMDANLWASIVTKIFEGLNHHINNKVSGEDEKRKIREEITKRLNITNRAINSLQNEKQIIAQKVTNLQEKKKTVSDELQKRIRRIKKKSIASLLEQLNESFQVSEKINTALDQNESFIKTSDQFKTIVPEEYWKNPSDIYDQFQSKKLSNVSKQFFSWDTWKSNLIWVLITIVVVCIPLALSPVIDLLEGFNFSPSHNIGILLTSLGTIASAIRMSYRKLNPIVASLWKIKEDYIHEKEAAIFQFQQAEKALKLEVKNFQLQINSINNRIEQAEEITKNLDFRINKTLSTETLFQFIEKKADSDDYKKYLGIVSTIRKDFEILSNLFQGSVEEQSDDESTNFIKENFPNLLDRIVLYIDDLDRCSEKRVVQVLEAVNLLMAFPLFIVVVGVDPRWVKIALEAKYQKQFTLKTQEEGLRISPSNYLEKIFQIPFRLKSAEDKTVKSMLKSLAEKKIDLPTSEKESENDSNLMNTISNDSAAQMQTKQGIEIQLEQSDSERDLNSPKNESDENPDNSNPDRNGSNKYILKPVSIPEDTKTEKEVIESLEFSEKEIKLIQEMSCVLGSNPRAIKRFVNIYRIMKAHDIFTYNPKTQDQEILADLFLIALPLGTYRRLVPNFLSFLNAPVNSKIKTYLSKSIPKNATDEQKKDRQVRKDLLDELNAKGTTILEIKKAHFNYEHTEFIKRFYFN